MSAGSTQYTTISVTPEVRDRVRRLKRGQESYSELFAKMAEVYEQEEHPPAGGSR